MNNEEIKQMAQYYRDVRNLKNFFIKHCHIDKKYEAYKIWAHWLIRNLCEVPENYHIIPSRKIENDNDILIHLRDKGIPLDQAQEFYTQVIRQTNTLYDTYDHLKCRLIHNRDLLNRFNSLIKTSTKLIDNVTYIFYQFDETFIKHSQYIHNKLVRSYRGPPELRNFYLFELGFNYYILDGHSLQWCLPSKMFDCLKNKLMTRVELFASPINSVMPLYCSLFVVDRQFGSMDNFFNLIPNQVLEGTFEINPPFIERIFIRSSLMIINFLEQSQQEKKDLMFIYIMPNWLDSQGYQNLINSPFLIDNIVVESNKHSYYQSNIDSYVHANFDTHILILGTDRAKARWIPAIKEELINSFTRTN